MRRVLTILIIPIILQLFTTCSKNNENPVANTDSTIVITGKYKILDCANIVQDNPSTCGVSAALTVLEYYGIDEYADNLAKKMNTSYETGTEMEEISNVMKSYGIDIKMGPMTISDLKQNINEKRPVIIMLQAYNPSEEYTDENTMKSAEWGHYVTVIGYGDNKIVFNDPGSYTKTFLSEDELEVRWKGIDEYKGRKPELLNKYGLIVMNRTPPSSNNKNILYRMK